MNLSSVATSESNTRILSVSSESTDPKGAPEIIVGTWFTIGDIPPLLYLAA